MVRYYGVLNSEKAAWSYDRDDNQESTRAGETHKKTEECFPIRPVPQKRFPFFGFFHDFAAS